MFALIVFLYLPVSLSKSSYVRTTVSYFQASLKNKTCKYKKMSEFEVEQVLLLLEFLIWGFSSPRSGLTDGSVQVQSCWCSSCSPTSLLEEEEVGGRRQLRNTGFITCTVMTMYKGRRRNHRCEYVSRALEASMSSKFIFFCFWFIKLEKRMKRFAAQRNCGFKWS